ncbi:hypothetical protein M3Y99_01338800 [Aphelenchoides fujianensis]|nr:hypothetical protein M3Y99_01338800 [Aphelenchoides fujianensis]
MSTPNESADALVHDFVVVNATTLVLHDGYSLWLLRLNVDELRVERTLLEEPVPTVVLTEIRGTNVRVKQAVLNAGGRVPLRFARLDVDAGRLEVDGEAEFPQEQPPFHSSEDGRSLYSFFFEYNHRPLLHVLDVDAKTRSTVDPAGDIEMMEECNVFWSPRHAYISGWAFVNWKRRFFVYSCDLERREWTKLPVITREPFRISPVLDATSGEDRGNFLVVCKAEKRIGPNDYVEEVRVYRPLRHPPPLVVLAVDALRTSRIDVDGEWGFHGCMGKTPCNRLLPPLFPNMTPIPRLNREAFAEESLQFDDSQLPAWRSGTTSR